MNGDIDNEPIPYVPVTDAIRAADERVRAAERWYAYGRADLKRAAEFLDKRRAEYYASLRAWQLLLTSSPEPPELPAGVSADDPVRERDELLRDRHPDMRHDTAPEPPVMGDAVQFHDPRPVCVNLAHAHVRPDENDPTCWPSVGASE